jgi:hypothetical protein
MMLIMLMTMKKKAGWWFQYDQHPVCKDAKGQITSLNPQLKHNINFKSFSEQFFSHIVSLYTLVIRISPRFTKGPVVTHRCQVC